MAVGLANKIVKPKLSKACDMRWHWLQDRVGQGQFRVQHIPSVRNVSEYFTKSLPLCRHKLLSPFIAVDDVPTPNDLFGSLRSLLTCMCFLLPP
jgi:hypothetical protein